MLIADLANAGSLPVLSESLRFVGARQRLLANNIANIDTPDYRPFDVSVTGFQAELRRAVDTRRAATGGEQGDLGLRGTGEVVPTPSGLELRPKTPSGNILYHDRNNRDLERMMQDLAENTLAFRTTTDLIRRENDLLRMAISQRV